MERKDPLHPVQKQMTDVTAVDRAETWVDWLVRREHRGPGDTIDAARLRAARKHRLPERILWALRYRKPKQICADLYLSIESAVAAEVKRQEARLEQELAITKALAPTADRLALIAETEAVLGSQAGAAREAAAERTN
jgi:hypothetical protein